MQKRDEVKSIDPSQWLEWEYKRPEGDLSTYAPNKKEALRTLAEHGFTNIDPKSVTCTNRLLSDVLKKESL